MHCDKCNAQMKIRIKHNGRYYVVYEWICTRCGHNKITREEK